MSEDADSAFAVDPTTDSISSCIQNVDASDVVICILDRRTGHVLPVGPWKGMTAVEAEVRHAIKAKKAVVYFVRDLAYKEFEVLRTDADYKTKWIDRNSTARWASFVKELYDLPAHKGRSNWFDQFRTSVDLRRIAKKRLVDIVPLAFAATAIAPDRLVRLYFEMTGSNHVPGWVRGAWRNAGTGSALRIRHGVMSDGVEGGIRTASGLIDGAALMQEGHPITYSTDSMGPEPWALFCEYQNKLGDHYRVEAPFDRGYDFLADRLSVNVGSLKKPKWVEVSHPAR
jgi:hypothetical protein